MISILDGVRLWHYQDFSIVVMKRPFGIIYQVSASGSPMKRTYSLRKMKDEIKLLPGKRIGTPVEAIIQ
jgi:hypothetical protein